MSLSGIRARIREIGLFSFIRDERGQSLPLLIAVMLVLLAAGVLVAWLALSTNMATVAQTAADAAALAGEKEVVKELDQPAILINGQYVTPTPDWQRVLNVADGYASDNGGEVVELDHPANPAGFGYDVIVIVRTKQGLPANSVDASKQAYAEARASTDPLAQASPTIPISNDASVASGPRFVAHGGKYGFFPNAGANFTVGSEPEIAGRLDQLGTNMRLRIVGVAGYTAASSSANASLQTCGSAATVTGLTSAVTGQKLNAAGLERIAAAGPGQPEEIALAGATQSSCAQGPTPTPSQPSLGNGDVHLVDVTTGGPSGSVLPYPVNGIGPLGGPWVIPTPIVMCESGGQNLTPNSAGASGYYQIIPSTWALFGGTQYTQQAYQAPKSIQDLIAARIWNNGAGAHNWDCASMVNWA